VTEGMEGFTVTVLTAILTVQLYTLFRHEKRLTKLETKIDWVLKYFNRSGGRSDDGKG